MLEVVRSGEMLALGFCKYKGDLTAMANSEGVQVRQPLGNLSNSVTSHASCKPVFANCHIIQTWPHKFKHEALMKAI